jgi:tRNA (guanine37-N1)-methyltransferase
MILSAPYYPKLFMGRYRRDSTPWATSVSTCIKRCGMFVIVFLVTSTDQPTAHLNLREQYLPYKKIIAEVLRDKCGNIRTVINKIENVGAESEFRTFNYEVLIGPDDLNVEVRENGCVFRFDYAKVYWNSKLEAEHTRIIGLFKPGEVVCDVMAGIGPFAVPAGKKGVFVWANDKNPESYAYLKTSIRSNKVRLSDIGIREK